MGFRVVIALTTATVFMMVNAVMHAIVQEEFTAKYLAELASDGLIFGIGTYLGYGFGYDCSPSRPKDIQK